MVYLSQCINYIIARQHTLERNIHFKISINGITINHL